MARQLDIAAAAKFPGGYGISPCGVGVDACIDPKISRLLPRCMWHDKNSLFSLNGFGDGIGDASLAGAAATSGITAARVGRGVWIWGWSILQNSMAAGAYNAAVRLRCWGMAQSKGFLRCYFTAGAFQRFNARFCAGCCVAFKLEVMFVRCRGRLGGRYSRGSRSCCRGGGRRGCGGRLG